MKDCHISQSEYILSKILSFKTSRSYWLKARSPYFFNADSKLVIFGTLAYLKPSRLAS